VRKKLVLPLVSLLLTFVALSFLVTLYYSHKLHMESFFNSDTLFLPALYRDFVHGRFSFLTWHFSAATFIFPDWILYAVARIVSGSIYEALPVFFTLQILIEWWLIYKIAEELFQEKVFALLTSTFGIVFLVLLVWMTIDPYTIDLLSVTHFGGFLCWTASSLIVLKLLGQGSGTITEGVFFLAGLWGLSLLTTASDKLFFVDWSVPSILSLVILWRWGRIRTGNVFFIWLLRRIRG